MRYLSPASLPDAPLTGLADVKALQLQRKKLLAELELSGGGGLNINGHTFSQSDILEYFESLQKENILTYHQALTADKVLVAFLETGELPLQAIFAASDRYDDPNFRQWISPYFYTAFTEYVYRSLENTDEPALQTILKNPLLLTDYDRERAWVRIGQMLEDNVAQLEHYHQQNKNKPTLFIDDISVLITDTLTHMILLFPKGPFTRVRNEYAFHIMEVCIYVFNNDRHNREYTNGWMEIAKLMAATQELRTAIVAKHTEMKDLRRKKHRSILVRVSLLLVFFMIKFMSNNKGIDTSDNSAPQFTNFVYNGDTIHDINELQKVLKQHHPKDSAHVVTPSAQSPSSPLHRSY